MEHNFKARYTFKHDTEENWLKATNFIPKEAEPIIYDPDTNHKYSRFKIGDGQTKINDLPFSTSCPVTIKTTLTTGEKVTVSFRPTPVGFEDLVDVQSLIDYNLLNEFMYNPDSIWKSAYMHKGINIVDPETNEVTEYAKLKFGPAWDFDWSMSYAYTGSPYTESFIGCARDITVFNNNIFFKDFLKDANNYEMVQDRWDEIEEKVKLVSNKLRDYKAYVSEASKFDAIMWYGLTGDFEFDMQYDYVRLFVLDRKDYFDEIFDLDHTAFLTKAKITVAQ